MNWTETAQQLKDYKENVVLIFALNSTGKTRLSVAYKNLTKALNDGHHSGVYYNAFSEDLFAWDNDEENNNEEIKLKINYSSLNQFHSFIIENEELIKNKLEPYYPKYSFELNQYKNIEKGIESVTFFLENNTSPIKISRGEERIFVWCFFLALFEVDGWTDVQNEHFFIDDPVSSLDDHNIFITAESIFKLIESSFNNFKKKIIITTHHIGLFSILYDKLKRGSKSDKYKNLTKAHILTSKNKELALKSHDKEVFLFHLHLLQTLSSAIDDQLYLYHFVLLRQLLENVSSFLGSGGINYALSCIGMANVEDAINIINSLSHQNIYRFQFNQMQSIEEDLFREILEKIKTKFKFKF